MIAGVHFHRAALTEFTQSTAWYEDQQSGLGSAFIAEVERCLARIVVSPAAFPCVADQTRRAVLRRFPFSILFQTRNARIVVIGVFHTHRDPKIWQRRSP